MHVCMCERGLFQLQTLFLILFFILDLLSKELLWVGALLFPILVFI